MHFTLHITAYYRTDSFPTNIRAAAESPSSVRLLWDLSPVNCDLIGYVIRYQPNATDDYYIYTYVDGKDTTAVTIAGLTPNTTYLFELSINRFAYGVYSWNVAKSVYGSTPTGKK